MMWRVVGVADADPHSDRPPVLRLAVLGPLRVEIVNHLPEDAQLRALWRAREGHVGRGAVATHHATPYDPTSVPHCPSEEAVGPPGQ
eukprot:13639767-Alexandrium_andersonii.AAC.1